MKFDPVEPHTSTGENSIDITVNMMLSAARPLSRALSATRYLRTAQFSTKHEALTDTFGRFHNYLRISLTEKCNLRCAYCMPEEGVHLTPKSHLMTLPERKRLISLFASLGVNKLRFTGGEPTISKDLEELIQHGNKCGMKSIGITSNGIILKERLDGLIKAGLTSVNISLDTLIDTKFATITRRDKKNIYRVLSSVYTAVSKGLPVKINCVLMRGFNDDELAQFVNLTKAVNVDVRFIELMPFDGNAWKPENFISYMEVIDRLKAEHGIELKKESGRKVRITSRSDEDTTTNTTNTTNTTSTAAAPAAAINNSTAADTASTDPSPTESPPVPASRQHEHDPSDTTKWYRASPSHLGRVGFITSMSSNFCGTCNRLRVTADGQLKVCLFGADGLNLLHCMRAGDFDEDIVAKLSAAVKQKKAALGGHTSASEIASHSSDNRPMILIGG